MLIGTGAVVVALAVGAGIFLGNRDVEPPPDPSLTGVESSIPAPQPAPFPAPPPIPVVETDCVGDDHHDHDDHREAGPEAGAGDARRPAARRAQVVPPPAPTPARDHHDDDHDHDDDVQAHRRRTRPTGTPRPSTRRPSAWTRHRRAA